MLREVYSVVMYIVYWFVVSSVQFSSVHDIQECEEYRKILSNLLEYLFGLIFPG